MRCPAVVLALLASSVLASAPAAQTPNVAAGPVFDVASVKRSDPDRRGSMVSGPAPTQFTTINAPLDRIIMYAYGLREYQLVGGPGWLRSDRFDIVAKYPEGWSRSQNPAQVSLMVRDLLADRFKLKAHTETGANPIYALVTIASDRRLGPKLRTSEIDCVAFRAALKASGQTISVGPSDKPTCMMVTSNRFIRASGSRLAILADVLSGQVGRPVIDRTGLTGDFDFDLEWSPELPTAVPFAAGDAGAARAPSLDDEVSIFTALREQLGLKLQPERGPVEVLVIDSVEQPTPN